MPRQNSVHLDHLVLEVRDPQRSLQFYSSILGLARVREREFLSGDVPFASVRVNRRTLIDLFPRRLWRGRKQTNPNHFCLTFSPLGFRNLKRRLKAAGMKVVQTATNNFGALGHADSIYLHDPDGVMVEARFYPTRPSRR